MAVSTMTTAFLGCDNCKVQQIQHLTQTTASIFRVTTLRMGSNPTQM